jgi:hypothetical protein
MQIFKQQPGLFKGALFAGDLHVHKHLCGRQDGRKSVHDLAADYAPDENPVTKENRQSETDGLHAFELKIHISRLGLSW